MSERTLVEGKFGALGFSDPSFSLPRWCRGRILDFTKTPVDENTVVPIMRLPKGLVIRSIGVNQIEATDQDVAVTFGLASDTTKAVGGSFALKDLSATNEAPCRDWQPAGSKTATATVTGGASGESVTVPVPDVVFVDKADVLCLILPNSLTGDKLAKGKIEVFVEGFEGFGEGYESANGMCDEPWRKKLQTTDNVSGGQIDAREFGV